MSDLDTTYRAQRTRLKSIVKAVAAAEWARLYRERDRATERTVQVVAAGQKQTATLVEAYLTVKLLNAGIRARPVPLDSARYTTEAIRGVPAVLVYDRVFGALGGQLEAGAEFGAAFQSAQASLDRLVQTDLQLSQTYSARDFMAAEERIVGFRRVLSPGKNCELCEEASTRTYRSEDLMPIHENCGCTVEPLFGEAPVASVGTTVRVVDDPEIGPRLVADTWLETGPRLIEAAA